MPDVVVTEAAVNEAATELEMIVRDFDDIDALWQDRGLFGHATLDDAMHDFIHGWWVKREKLKAKLKSLQEGLQKTAETWDDVDSELAQSLNGEG